MHYLGTNRKTCYYQMFSVLLEKLIIFSESFITYQDIFQWLPGNQSAPLQSVATHQLPPYEVTS